MAEQRSPKPKVVGSIPASPAIIFEDFNPRGFSFGQPRDLLEYVTDKEEGVADVQ